MITFIVHAFDICTCVKENKFQWVSYFKISMGTMQDSRWCTSSGISIGVTLLTRKLCTILASLWWIGSSRPRLIATTVTMQWTTCRADHDYRIDGVMEDDLRAGLFIASSCLLRRDATWIFRLLDQRGMVQRDDLYQLLHVYCNDHWQPFGIHFALSLLKYCEKQSEKNAYIRRPDPLGLNPRRSGSDNWS